MTKTKGYVSDPDGFFPTPVECTQALLEAEGSRIPIELWEAACGDGAIIRAMPAREWIATDLVNHGCGIDRVDFLMERKKLADAIVTNPPFHLMEQFINHAIELDVDYIAIFHRTTFINTDGWLKICDRRTPSRIYTLNWRPDYYGIGSPDQRCSFMWSVWDRAAEQHRLGTVYKTMRRPVNYAKR